MSIKKITNLCFCTVINIAEIETKNMKMYLQFFNMYLEWILVVKIVLKLSS